MMRAGRLILTVLFIATAVGYSYAQTVIYKKVNEDGTVTYSDTPIPGAVEITLDTKAVVIPSSPTPSNNQPPQSLRTQKEYKLAVTSPANDATIRSNAGEINITAKLEPSLGGMYTLDINGKTFQSPSGIFKLENMDRGEHKYKVSFSDNSGKVLASSEQRTLFLHRASVLFPNR